MSICCTGVHSFAGLGFTLHLPLAAFALEEGRFNVATACYYRLTENRGTTGIGCRLAVTMAGGPLLLRPGI